MKKSMCLLAVFGCSVAIAGSLVSNGGFDVGTVPNKAEGWSLPKDFRLSETEGLNGARGLVWERSESRMSSGASQPVKLIPGKKYRFSCYLKIDKPLGGEKAKDGVAASALLIVAYKDANGKWLGESYSQRNIRDTKGEWMKVEGQTRRIGDNVASATISAFVWHMATGKVFFDDIYMEEISENSFGTLSSSAYRDLAWDGFVTFTAAMNLDRATKISDYRIQLAIADGKKGTRRIDVTDFTHSLAKVTIPVAELPMGASPVSLEIWRIKDGALLQAMTLLFTRTGGAPERKCWIDRHNRLIVNGEPFFPLASYTYGLSEKDLDYFTRGAFNTVLPYPYMTAADFDRIQARGLKVIATVKDCFRGAKCAPAKFRTHEDADRYLVSRVEELKNHPAVIAWYMNDESPLSDLDRLVRQYQYVRKLDPNHPAYSVLCQPDELREYKKTCDVMGTDPYPIGDKPIGLASDWTRATCRDFLGGPVWQVPQAFAWKWWQRGDDVTGRVPTRQEFRNMSWQMIANGANGLCIYCFGTLLSRMPRAEFEQVWNGYCEVSREIATQIPVMLSVESAPTVASSNPRVACRTWCKDGKVYLLVANETDKKLTSELTLSKKFSSSKAAFGEGEVKLSFDGNKVTAEVAPMGAAMLQLD